MDVFSARRHLGLFLLILSFHLLLGAKQDPRYKQSRVEKITSSNLDFSLQILNKIVDGKDFKSGVALLSPVSLVSALHLALMGAYKNTLRDIGSLMKYQTHRIVPYKLHEEYGLILEDMQNNAKNASRPRPEPLWKKNVPKAYSDKIKKIEDPKPNYDHHNISIANAVFYEKEDKFRPEYLEATKDVFKAFISGLDFKNNPKQAVVIINDWISKFTNGKIPKMLEDNDIDESTKLALVNTVFFKADWQQEFSKGMTRKRNFFPDGQNGGVMVSVDMMYNKAMFPTYYDEELQTKFLALPYKQNATTMYIIQPDVSEGKSRIREISKALTAKKINDVIDKMEISVSEVEVYMPKMNLSFTRDYVQDFKDFGYKSLFNKDCNMAVMEDAGPESTPANIDRSKKMSPAQILDQIRAQKNLKRPDILISKILQKVKLGFDEKGTEGVAATVITASRSIAQRFLLNEPFMFLIRHDSTGAILFHGIVFDPTKADK